MPPRYRWRCNGPCSTIRGPRYRSDPNGRPSPHTTGARRAPALQAPARGAPRPQRSHACRSPERHRVPRASPWQYKGGDVGVDAATFNIRRGEFVFLVGSTGSGKSTIMRLLIKEREPTSGTIRVAGRDLVRDHEPEGPVLPPQHRRRLPGLQAPAEPHRVRERRLRALGHRRVAQGDPGEGAGHPAPHRPLAEAPQLPRPALRRRAAARVGRARVREPPAAPAGRRADGQPRPDDVDRDHAAALPDQPDRHDRPRGDARLPHGRPHAPPRHRALRRHDRARRGRRPVRAARADDGRVRPDAHPRGARPPRPHEDSGSSCARRPARWGATPCRPSPRWRRCSSRCSSSASSSRSCRPRPAPRTRCRRRSSSTST